MFKQLSLAICKLFSYELDYFVVTTQCPVFWEKQWAYDHLIRSPYAAIQPGDILVHNTRTLETWKLGQ